MNIKTNKFFKLICLIILLFNITLLFSCSKKDQVPNHPDVDYTVFPTEVNGIIKDKKIYVTSIGQDSEMIKFQLSTLEKQTLFEYTIDSFLDANNVEEGSVVFLFVGCSIKALTESSVTLEDELERANEFASLSKNKKITLIVIHAGGNARRGSTSDSFIKLMFSNSTFNVFVESGNFDNYLSNLSIDNNIPCYQIASSLSLSDVVVKLYGDNE